MENVLMKEVGNAYELSAGESLKGIDNIILNGVN